jgi:hypothetical protein
LSDRVSFLGETVFKYASESSTSFTLGLERAIIKYNFSGNHNLVFGKHHTPVNYWNDTYHHGRLFFPTIFRPAMFTAGIVPLHTTGIGIQGHDLGGLKFGYDVMAGNGIGSSDVADNNKEKSYTAAIHIKPLNGMRIGGSAYYDVIAAGGHSHTTGTTSMDEVKQLLLTGSLGYFGDKVEFLGEGTWGNDHTDSLGNAPSTAYYVYAGYKIFPKVHLYGRFDQLLFDKREMYFVPNDLQSMVGGLRFQINYITVVKLEFQHDETKTVKNINTVNAQFAIGF